MKKNLQFIALLMVLFSYGQVTNYSFSSSSGTYNGIVGTQIISPGIDDGSSSATNIGFNFTFNGTVFTQFVANSNGCVRLGSSAPSSGSTALSNTSNTNTIAFFSRDGKAVGGVFYELAGTAPNRKLTIQYTNYAPQYNVSTNLMDAQIVLYETSNVIEIVYGSSTTSATYYAQVGIRGSSASSDYLNRTSTSSWLTSTSGTSSSSTMTFSSTVYPNSGLSYVWSPPSPCLSPVDQPTNLIVSSVTSSSISGSFTAAAGAPSGYLVVRSTSATPPAPVDGTTYSVGSASLGAGTSVIANGSATVFTSSSLAGNTTYYYHIFSYNNAACSGGPKYNTVSPLYNSATTCPAAPATTAATTVTASDFTANWTAPTNGADGYLLYVATDISFTNVVPGYNGLTVGAVTSYAVTGLTAATNYYYRVVAVGSACNSGFSATRAVTTSCLPENAPTQVQDFATFTGSAPAPICWSEASGDLTASTTLTGTTSNWLKKSNGFANANSANVAAAVNLFSNSTNWLISNQIDLGTTPGMYRLKYKYAVTSYNGTAAVSTLSSHKVDVVVSTDGGATWSNTNIIKTYAGAGTYSNTGAEELVNLTSYSGVIKIAFVATCVSSTDIDFHLDDVQVEAIPSCISPTDLAATAITDTQAVLSWSTGGSGESSWDIALGVNGFSPTGTPTQTGVSNAYTYSGLTPNTAYEYYVRADCGGGDWSVWSGPYAFTTLCTAVSEFTLNFDADTNLPACTQKSGTAGSVSVSSSYSQSAPNGLYMYSSGATYVLPRINNAEATTHRLKFAARSSASTTIRMGYMTDPSDPATFTSYQTINTSTSFQQFVVLPNGAPPAGSYLALQATSNSSTYIDDLVWEAIPAVAPTCVAITLPANNQTDVNVTTNISWATQIDATGYKVYLGTATDTYDVLNGQDVGNVTTYSLNGSLNYNTTYYVKIVPYNAFGEASACSEMMFTTKDGCVVPYTPVNGATAVVVNPTIQWSAYTGATAYEISIGTTAGGTDLLNAYNNGTSTSYAVSGLAFNTVYYVTVKAVGATDVTTAVCANYSFTTKTAPQTVPYVQDFENATSEILLTGSNANAFFIGNATQNGGSKALYISNDNGVSNAYSNNTTSTAWASVEVDLTTATYVDLVFDWKAIGESSYDYGEVYINTGGSDIRISGVKEFQGSDVFQTKRLSLSSYTGQVVVIKFKWYNDGSFGSNPPLAIDNLKVIDYVEYANANWSNVSGPTATINAFISDHITLTSDLEAKDLTIHAGQVVTVAPGVTLTVTGNLTNNGSIVFQSDATGTASFGTYNGAAISGTGTVTTERYIGAKRAWRMLTAPLKGTTNNSVYANWQNNGVVNPGTGVDLWGPSGTGLHTGPAYSIKKYPTQASATTWVNVTNTMTEPLFDANGNKAFTIFVTGSYSTTPTTIASGANATVLAATGALLTGDVAYANLPTDIHTYIGNPYASPLDPSALLTEATNAAQFNQLWVWDPELATVGGYLVYDPIIGWSNTAASYSNTTTTMIQSGQAFFVKPAAVANFTIKESHKGTMVDNGVFAKNNPIAQLRINLQQQNAGVWQPEDAVVAAFYTGGDNGITAWDAQKMEQGGVNIAFTNSQERLTVEHREPAMLQDVLPMQLTGMNTAVAYRLLLHVQAYTGLQPYLWDTLTNGYYPIPTDGTVYEHVFTVNDVQLEQQRFQIVFDGAQLANASPTRESLKVYPNPITNGLCKVMLPTGATEASYTITSQVGQKVTEGSWTGPNGQIATQGWAAGVYHLTVKVGTAVYRQKIMVQ
jgi:hypothetical protein